MRDLGRKEFWEILQFCFSEEKHCQAAKKYPRLKAYVYYDAGRSAVFSKANATQNKYREYLRLPTFRVNDNGRRELGCPALCDEL